MYQEHVIKVDENIKQKEYVRTMRSDFGTSTSEHQIATNIAIMSSVQVANQATLHNAYIEQLKFLRVVCAGRYLKKSPKICGKKTFFSKRTTRRKIEKNLFS